MAITLSAVPRWLLTTAVALLAIGASAPSLPNVFVQDDIPVVLKNQDNHTISTPWTAFTRPYWPKPFSPDLYRPLMSVGLATQWVAGGGSPVVFRVTSILLYVASAVAFFWLAAMLLPVEAAWVAAALFAVHPVHVEAVAVAVNQGELIVGLIATLWVGMYIGARRRGDLGVRSSIGFVATYLVACFFKENAVILPGLLIAAEMTVIRDDRPFMSRVAAVRPLVLALAATGLAFLSVRSAVLDNVVGSFTAEGLQGLSAGQRALTMLGVVPEWLRLFAWPAHLQADYSPQEITGALAWGTAQTLGLFILASAVIGALAARRTAPVATFGIIWVAIALFPVSNVLVPTGIVLAERTLYLASVGFLLIVGALLPAAFRAIAAARPPIRRAALAALVAPAGGGQRGQCPAAAYLGQSVFAVGAAAHRRAAQLSVALRRGQPAVGRAPARGVGDRVPARAHALPQELRRAARTRRSTEARGPLQGGDSPVPAGASLCARPERGPFIDHRLSHV